MKKMIGLFVLVLMTLTTALFSAEVVVGGFLPLINNVAPMPVTSLDFSQAQTDQVICKVLINNNKPTGWSLETTFDNSDSLFRAISGTDTTTITAESFEWTVNSTNKALYDSTATLTSGNWDTIMASPTIDTATDSDNALRCDNGRTPTKNLIVDMICDWQTPISFTGFYQKTITLVMADHP